MTEDDGIPEEPWRAYVKGIQVGRQEARERILLQTPQSLLMRTKQGEAWLEQHPIAQLANDIVHYYFDLARIVARATTSTESMRRNAEESVLACARAWILPPEDTPQVRLRVFLGYFAQAIEDHYRRPREAYTTPLREEHLPKDPEEAESRRREIEQRRDQVLLPGLAPHAAKVTLDWFFRLYPDERGKIDPKALAEAIEAFGLDRGRPGRRPQGTTGKYNLLSKALEKTSFGSALGDLKGPVNRAIRADAKRRNERRQAAAESANEEWLPPENPLDPDEEG
jgi:hypothetical protein